MLKSLRYSLSSKTCTRKFLDLCITMCWMFFLRLSLFFCYNMNLYFGPAALHYIKNNILSYILSYKIVLFVKGKKLS